MTMRPASHPQAEQLEERFRRNLGRVVIATRWMLAPVYLGLIMTFILLAAKFVQKLISGFRDFLTLSSTDMILLVLQLVDLALVANLVLMVIFSGWQSVIGPFLTEGRPVYRGLGFGALEQTLVASVASIATIQILETFLYVDKNLVVQALWQLAILLGIGITGVLLALMRRINSDDH